jgi:ABC-type branched-subunit amino acid transport system substrate-binding protein
MGAGLSAAPAPFLHLRDTTLGYHGPSAELTNLTELRIGWFGPTNLDDPLTGDLWWAASLAIREANEAQGRKSEIRNPKSEGSPNPETRDPKDSVSTDVRRSDLRPPTSDFRRLPFRLVPRWAVDPWGTGVSQLARMVYTEQPLALIGSVDSASTHLAEQVVAKANLPLVSPWATDQSVTLAGVSWMFACAPADTAVARLLVDDILAALAARGADEPPAPNPQSAVPAGRLALLTCTDHESRMATRAVLHEFSRRGRLPDLRLDIPPAAPEITRQMERLAGAAPAVVLIIAGAEDSARLVRAARARLPGSPPAPPAAPVTSSVASQDAAVSGPILFGSHTMGRARFRELAGTAAEGVRFPRLVATDPADARWARFAERFQAERGRAPDYAAVLAYDATCLLIEAIHCAGPNRARIRDALSQLSPWPGLAGPIEFDGTGQNGRAAAGLSTIRDGVLVPLRAVARQTPVAHNLSGL